MSVHKIGWLEVLRVTPTTTISKGGGGSQTPHICQKVPQLALNTYDAKASSIIVINSKDMGGGRTFWTPGIL